MSAMEVRSVGDEISYEGCPKLPVTTSAYTRIPEPVVEITWPWLREADRMVALG
jgi:hypothetical protein